LILAYVLHIGGGAIGLGSGTVAAVAKKGGTLHRTAGTVFFVSMLTMATFAALLAVVVRDQSSNLFGAAFTFYLIVTAWLTVRRPEGTIGISEKVALAFILAFSIPFALLVYSALTGSAPAGPKGPVLIATYVLGAVVVIAAFADLKVVLMGGVVGAARLARHLWRMSTALIFATGSAFTNGLPRLLPGPMHVPPAFFLPMLLPLALLIFWMVRVRLTGWATRSAIASQSAR
jgi:hypothetical protein